LLNQAGKEVGAEKIRLENLYGQKAAVERSSFFELLK
jgi:hypothetical protein